MLWKCRTQYASKFGKLSSCHRTGKCHSLAFKCKKCSNYCTIVLISHASKVMLKILQARLQQYMNCELPDIQAGFRKGRGTRDQIANIPNKRVPEKVYFCFIDYAKPLTVWITTNCGKFWKWWEYQTTWPASWETYMQVKKQQLELYVEQQTGSK